MVKKKISAKFGAVGAVIAALVLVLFCVGYALADEPSEKTLKVAFPRVEGISEIDRYGNHTGLMVDYLNEIAKYTGWNYDYIEVEPESLVDDFINGEYDLMGGTFYSPSFEEYFAYPDYNMGRSIALLICRRDDETIKGYDLSSIEGKTIGVYENATEKIRYLEDFLSSNYIECNLEYYTHDDMYPEGNLYQKLRSGEVDMLLANESELDGEFRTVTSFQAQPYYIVAQVGDTETIAAINSAMDSILESVPTFAEETFNKNFPDIQMVDIQLNEDELAYIAEKQTVTVSVPIDTHPLYCVDKPIDHHDGIVPDILKVVSDFSGLEFEFVFADTYAESIEMVQNGEAEIVGAYLGSEEAAFEDNLSLSRSYVTLTSMVLKNKAVSFPGEDLTCGVLKGRALPSEFEAAEVRSYDTVSQLISAVNDGDVDYIYGVSSLMEQEMQTKRYVNVVPVSQVTDSTEVSFGIAQPITPELLTILNKAVCAAPTSDKNDILNRNLVSVGYNNMSLRDLIYDNPLGFTLIFVAVLIIIITVVLLFFRNRMQNAIMESRLKAAEAKSTAKSEFLSRMSHEIRTPMNAIVGLTDLACMEQEVPSDVEKKLKQIRNSSRYLLALINDILDMSRIENEKMEIEQENFSLPDLLADLEDMMRTQADAKDLQFNVNCQIEHPWLIGDPVRLRQVLTNLLSNAMKFTPAGGTVTLDVTEVPCDSQKTGYRFSVIDNGIGIPLEDQERIFASFEQVTPSASNSVGTGLGLPISRSIARLMGGDLEVKSQPGKGSEFYTTLCFPLGIATEATIKDYSAKPHSLTGVKALLVEDNDLNAEIACELLAKEGIDIDRAINGKDGVEMFAQSDPGTYKVILMDILMPVMDGYEATKKIRSSGHPDANIPIVAMTANSFKEDEIAARSAGMSGFVPKPVDVALLLRVLRELL